VARSPATPGFKGAERRLEIQPWETFRIRLLDLPTFPVTSKDRRKRLVPSHYSRQAFEKRELSSTEAKVREEEPIHTFQRHRPRRTRRWRASRPAFDAL